MPYLAMTDDDGDDNDYRSLAIMMIFFECRIQGRRGSRIVGESKRKKLEDMAFSVLLSNHL